MLIGDYNDYIRSIHPQIPQSLTWNLKMMVSNRNLLFQGLIFRFHVNLQGCTYFTIHFYFPKWEFPHYKATHIFNTKNYADHHLTSHPGPKSDLLEAGPVATMKGIDPLQNVYMGVYYFQGPPSQNCHHCPYC